MNTYQYAMIATALLTSVSVHAQQAVQWKASDGGKGIGTSSSLTPMGLPGQLLGSVRSRLAEISQC